MRHAARAERLIDAVYDTVGEPERWQRVAEALSEAFGGAAISLGIQLPGRGAGFQAFRVHLTADYAAIFFKHTFAGTLPWGSIVDPLFQDGFHFASERLPDAELPGTDFYREWMQPQGLAPAAPMVHAVGVDGDVPEAGIAIYQRVGGRAFTPADLEFANLLAPHLRRAFLLSRRLAAARQRRDALAEVIDRVPQGVILLDTRGRVVTTNRRAEQIAAQDDGFCLAAAGLRAGDPRADSGLRDAIHKALEGLTGMATQNVLTIPRPSGRPNYGVIVTRLVGEPQREDDPALIVFVGDPDAGHVSLCQILRRLYSLTEAEAELVQLLVDGRSLEEAAAARGVTRNTARTQLKHVFAKTGTKRQGELVRLVLAGVAPIE
jgi:DNA-binding CsgD family transcriptional regulator/PAS domain-containing protein